jgi:four helix bundle protein
MEREATVKHKSLLFAKRIIRLYKYLCDEKKEYVLSKQLLRSGTSIGANIAEAECGISKKDFLAKMYIAFKECAETAYWLELLLDDYIAKNEYESIKRDCDELMRMLTSITKTTHSSLHTTNCETTEGSEAQ